MPQSTRSLSRESWHDQRTVILLCMIRGVVSFVTIIGMLPSLIRWVMNGSISIQAAALLMLLIVVLLSLGSRAVTFTGPVIAVIAFALQYAPEQTWPGLLTAASALLPLGIALFGIYIMLSSFRHKHAIRDTRKR